MNITLSSVQRKLLLAWNAILHRVSALSPDIRVLPRIGHDIFQLSNVSQREVIRVDIKPTIFWLPERANGQGASLYVAIGGFLEFATIQQKDELVTHSFGTRIGYFKVKGRDEEIEHVYGAHYDCVDSELSPDHPVFHSHIESQLILLSDVNIHFRKEWPIDIGIDRVSPLLSTVRTPTAQMDFFSVIIQICADHLLHKDSDPKKVESFVKLQEDVGFFIGAARRFPCLCTDVSTACYRSLHWYPQ